MSQVIINDVPPYTQASASGGQTVYGTNWTANYASDVIVYNTPVGTSPDDFTQILSYPSQYTVSFVGALQEVQVTLVTPSTLGDIVTITRMTPADRENLYSNTNFLPSMLNNDFGILTLVDQQAQLVNQLIGPRYNYSAIITPIVDTILPILGENEIWIKNSNNTAITTTVLPASGVAPANGTYLTYTNQTATLPNSYQLLAGTNVTLTPGVNTLTVSVTSETINPGTANELAYYATSGTAISGLATGNNGVLVTSAGGVPSISTTLPANLIIPTPLIDSIKDTSGNTILFLTPAASAVNSIRITNSATGVSPSIGVTGSDTNIPLTLSSKGTGVIALLTAAPTQPLLIYSGTSNQHLTRFNMANTAADRSITWQDASGTVAFLSDVPSVTPAALTKTDDTNVTLTLGGSPTVALLAATSLTLGWTGTLSATRGGLGVSNPTAHGILIGEGASAVTPIVLSAGQILIGTTAGDPVGATLTSGTGVSITSASGVITISSSGGGQTWSTITAATLAAAINNSYVLNHAATPCVVTLPPTAPVGSKIGLRGLAGSGGWTATANTSQTIQFGNQSSSSAGSWSSTDPGDCCDLECIVANTTWVLTNAVSSGLTKV